MTTHYTEATVREWALSRIPEKRHAHVQGVVEAAAQLSMRYTPDQIARARLAGWLHDSSKHLSGEALLQHAESFGYAMTATERQVPMLLHGAVGYLIANATFGFNDPLLLSACAYHTTGHPDMNTLDQVVMVADLIEPTRDYNRVDELRALAHQDLSQAVLLSTDFTISYILHKGQILDERMVVLRNKLITQGVIYP